MVLFFDVWTGPQSCKSPSTVLRYASYADLNKLGSRCQSLAITIMSWVVCRSTPRTVPQTQAASLFRCVCFFAHRSTKSSLCDYLQRSKVLSSTFRRCRQPRLAPARSRPESTDMSFTRILLSFRSTRPPNRPHVRLFVQR